MSRISGARVQEVGDSIYGQCLENGNVLMDSITAHARRICPVGTVTRKEGYAKRFVSFIPKSGRKSGTLVEFMANTWIGRSPGSLRDSVRRVNSRRKPGSIRVYAGHYKVFYAFMVERGTVKTRPQPFLGPAWNSGKARALTVLKNGGW